MFSFEVERLVFARLNVIDFCSLRQTCRTINRTCQDPILTQKIFRLQNLQPQYILPLKRKKGWKKKYIRKFVELVDGDTSLLVGPYRYTFEIPSLKISKLLENLEPIYSDIMVKLKDRQKKFDIVFGKKLSGEKKLVTDLVYQCRYVLELIELGIPPSCKDLLRRFLENYLATRLPPVNISYRAKVGEDSTFFVQVGYKYRTRDNKIE